MFAIRPLRSSVSKLNSRITTTFMRKSSGHSDESNLAMKDIDPHWDPRGSGSGRNDGWQKSDPSGHANLPLWRNMTFFVALPAVVIMSIVMYLQEKEHIAHPGHGRPPFVAYEYLRRRTKPFPWGDGNHSLFHNKWNNALPDGYETELPEEDGHGHH